MSISRNAAYNLAGYAIPAILLLATVPAYLHLLGGKRYGILAFAWLLLGYFGVFDLGLGRATAQRIAASHGTEKELFARTLVSALTANFVLSLMGATALLPLAGLFLAMNFQSEPALLDEAIASLPWLALAVPVTTTSGVLSGAMMGRERFAGLNIIATLSSVLFQLLPLAYMVASGPDLPGVIAASVTARLIGLVMLWSACRSEFGRISLRGWDWLEARKLLSFGSWITATALVAPLLTLSDRFLVGTALGALAVTVYTIPADLTQRLGNVASSIGNALLPRLALASGEDARLLVSLGVRALYTLLTPPVTLALFVADPLFRLWLGDNIGGQAAPLARIMLVAIWFNSFAQMSYIKLQASGRPDKIAKLLLIETPIYLTVLWFALHAYGLWGASLVFLMRMVLDGIGMFILADRRIEQGWLLLPTLAILILACIILRDMLQMAMLEAAMLGLAAGLVLAAPGLVMIQHHFTARKAP